VLHIWLYIKYNQTIFYLIKLDCKSLFLVSLSSKSFFLVLLSKRKSLICVLEQLVIFEIIVKFFGSARWLDHFQFVGWTSIIVVSSLSMSLFMFDFEPPHLTLFQTLNKTLFCFKLQIILQTLKKFLNKPTQFTLFFSPSRWSCYHFVLHLCVNFLYTILIYKIWLKKHYSFVSLCKFILKRKTKNLIQSPKKTLIHMFFFQIRNCSIVLACSLFLFISEK